MAASDDDRRSFTLVTLINYKKKILIINSIEKIKDEPLLTEMNAKIKKEGIPCYHTH